MSDHETHSAGTELERLIREAYEGEITGEAMYVTLQSRATDDHQREACRLLAEIENVTGQLIGVVAVRHNVQCDDDGAWRRGEEFFNVPDEDWLALWQRVIPPTESALVGMKRLQALCDDHDRPAIDRLVAHEEALLEFAHRETAGSADALGPLAEYLAEHRRINL